MEFIFERIYKVQECRSIKNHNSKASKKDKELSDWLKRCKEICRAYTGPHSVL
jgi:hypothetical protein